MNTVLTAILAVFSAIGDWITTTVTDLTPMFYNSTDGLTLMGTLCVASLGFSVVFLLIGIIQRFFKFGA